MTLAGLSHFYKNLSELHSAGLHFSSLFDSLKETEKDLVRRHQFQAISTQVRAGHSLAESFSRTKLVPTFDLPLIRAGEKSGTLLLVFESLSRKYELSAKAEKTIRNGLIRPLFSLVVALFVPNVPDLLTGKITMAAYCWNGFGFLFAIVAVAIFLYYLHLRCYFDLHLARQRHQVYLMVPYVAGLARNTALEKFVFTLAFTLEAGLPVFEALEHAGRSSADAEITAATDRIAKSLRAGHTFPQAFQPESIFTQEIKNSILLGNESGKIPGFLHRTGLKLQKENADRIEKISKAIPHIVYWLVTLFVMYKVVGFYTARFDDLNKVMSESPI